MAMEPELSLASSGGRGAGRRRGHLCAAEGPPVGDGKGGRAGVPATRGARVWAMERSRCVLRAGALLFNANGRSTQLMAVL